MSRHSARLVAAGLWTFGAIALVMLAVNLDPAGLMGTACVVTATSINTITAVDASQGAPAHEEPKPSDTSAH